MRAKLSSVIKFYDDYTIGYIRYGGVNIWASYGSTNDSMYRLIGKIKELRETTVFY